MQDEASNRKLTASVTMQVRDAEPFQQSVSLGPFDIGQGSTEGMHDLGKFTHPPVGRCIYCSATDDLRREHIIPFGLCPFGPGKDAVLHKATCGRCARVTGDLERQILRGPMRDVRVLRRLRSRSRHAGARGTERLTIVRIGVREDVELPLDEYPILLTFPTFAPPAFLSGGSCSGINIAGVTTTSFGPRPDSVLKRLGGQQIVLHTETHYPIAFARMLAKVGYAMAFAQAALARLDGPCLALPAILGHTDDIGQWVGTATEPIRKYPSVLHRIALHEDREKQLLLAQVQLFADSETPSYWVVLGRLKVS